MPRGIPNKRKPAAKRKLKTTAAKRKGARKTAGMKGKGRGSTRRRT